NRVRIKIHPFRDREMPIDSSFKVTSQCVIPLVERPRVNWPNKDSMWRWEEVDARGRRIKYKAILSRLGAPVIDCLVIGDLRSDVLGNLSCTQSDIKPVEHFVFNCRIRTYCSNGSQRGGNNPNKARGSKIHLVSIGSATNKEGDVAQRYINWAQGEFVGQENV